MNPPLGRDLAVRVASEVALSLRGFVVLPFVTRALGVAGYGVFAQLWLTVSLIVPIFSLSLDNGIIRNVSGDVSLREQADAVWTALLAATACAAVPIVPLLFVKGNWLGALVFGPGNWSSELMLTAVLCGFAVPLAVGQGFFQARQEIVLVSVFQFLRSVGGAFAMVVAAAFGAGVGVIVGAAACVEAIALIVLLAMIHRRLGPPQLRWGVLPAMLAFSLPLAASNGLYVLSNAIPRYVLVQTAGLAAVGVYSAAFSLLVPVGQAVSPLHYVVYPEAMRRWKRGEKATTASLIVAALVGFFAIAALVVAVASALAGPALRLLAGRTFVASPTLFAAVGAGVTAIGLFRLGSLQLLVLDRSARLFGTLAVGTAGSVAASWLFVPRLGAEGAGLAFLAGNALLVVVLLAQVRETELPGRLGASWPALARCSAAAIAAYVATRAVSAAGALGVLVAAAGGTACFAMVFLALGGAADLRRARAALLASGGPVPSAAP